MKKRKIEFYNKSKLIEHLNCEVAETYIEKTQGLMFREKLSDNEGMIFYFLLPWFRIFWMKNVKIPLDILFVNRKKRIVKIYEAPVEKKIFYRFYYGFCKYVIETNKDFCRNHNIKTNDKIKII